MQLQGKETSLMTQQGLCVGVLNYLKMLRALDKVLKDDVHRFRQSFMKKQKDSLEYLLLLSLLLFCVFWEGKQSQTQW